MRTTPIPNTREELLKIIDEAAENREPVELESEGERLAVLLPPTEYDRMKRVYDGAIENAWNAIDEIRKMNAHRTEEEFEELERIITETVEEVRQERYEQRQAKSAPTGD